MHLVLTLAVAAALVGGEPRVDRAERIVFLGDSITHAGIYVRDVEGYLLTRFPDRKRSVLNLGLSSETASGLSEAEHPWPRPNVHERLTRALEATRPDLVVACYGMNDGIYHPFGDERFAAFRSGISRLHDQATRAGASVVIITPLPFDVRPSSAKARPFGADDYGFIHPYTDYDRTLGRYADWLVAQKTEGWTVVDAHASAAKAMADAQATDPGFAIARDGVHPDAAGHWLIAEALLLAWGLPTEVDVVEIDASKQITTRGEVRFQWTTRVPMPHAPGWDHRPAGAPAVADRFNVHRLSVAHLTAPRYALSEEGRRLGEFDRDQMARGIDLLKLSQLSTNRRSAAIRPLLDAREKLLGAAWLSAVGHKRPGVAPGLPLEEAKAKAEEIERQIRRLAEPVPVEFRLEPMVP